MHPEFAAALKGNAKAQEVLDGFPPSAQREYLDWVAEAKQDATRAKRIADAVQWLSEGKRRHWKYENC
nr:YdeI/OmpD-associated family protein [Sphingomonas caseinilyticus]